MSNKKCLATIYSDSSTEDEDPDTYIITLYTIQGLLKKYPELKFDDEGDLVFSSKKVPTGVNSDNHYMSSGSLHFLGRPVEAESYGPDWEENTHGEDIPNWAVKNKPVLKNPKKAIKAPPEFETFKVAGLTSGYLDVKLFKDGSMKVGCQTVNTKGSKDLFKKLAEVHGYTLE